MKKSVVFTSLFLASSVNAYEVKNLEINSLQLDKKTNVSIVLPDSYAQGQEYSVVYVLHGWAGNQKSWLEETSIAKQADLHDLIIVLPDGDYDKWYIDSPENKSSKYQSYIGKELVDYIDENFNTIEKKSQRAITGLSMGGFGALNIVINNKSTFGNVGSISGGVDPTQFKYNWGLESVFGSYEDKREFWDKKVIANNAHQFIFSGINIALDCGIDDFFITSNRALHDTLQDMEIEHDYTERPGGHTWDYWDNAIQYQMLFFANKFTNT